MKLLKLLLIVALLFGFSAGSPAWADRGHHHFHGHAGFGAFIAVPLFYPWYYSPYPPPYPPVYVEQGDPASGQNGYWYLCDNPSGYYPYVKECPAGWRKVVPTPPSS